MEHTVLDFQNKKTENVETIMKAAEMSFVRTFLFLIFTMYNYLFVVFFFILGSNFVFDDDKQLVIIYSCFLFFSGK